MIAKSDLVILTLSTAALAVGIVRWQHATTVVPAVTVQASARQAAPVPRVADPVPGTAPAVTSLPARGENAPVEPVRAAPVVRRLPAAGDASGGSATAASSAPAAPTAAVVGDAPVVAAEPEYGVYRVRSGDFLGRIAQRHGTTVATLRELNGIRGSTIQIGQRIRYPLPAN